jgi:hypothetical protein
MNGEMQAQDLKKILDHIPKSHDVVRSLRELFTEYFRWNTPSIGEQTIELKDNRQVRLQPIAKCEGIYVFSHECEEDFFRKRTLRRTLHRKVHNSFPHHCLVYITPDRQTMEFVWARTRTDKKIELRTLPYEVGSHARTTLERLTRLQLPLAPTQFTFTEISERVAETFSVEAVTEDFFKNYCDLFDHLQTLLREQNNDPRWAHDYALQCLNRILFLYFIQRKRWINEDPNFLRSFWNAYKNSGQPKDSFFKHWLSILFFEAFNKKFHGGYTHFPDEIRKALQLAPYLNGGLFTANDLDNKHRVNLPDRFFEMLFDSFNATQPGFFERYNFTITESTPFDIEVAVDPQMIGEIYERLVNMHIEGNQQEDRRGAAGIFYTPRTEIDLMCRLSLVDALTNRLGTEHKHLLYDAVFATDPDEKEHADKTLTERNLWPNLNQHLRSLTVCDPACGSGSFLVGMLLVLDDLQARADSHLGIEETPYERRRRIIGEQLYGVDVMDWAVHVAELRLWLQLVVETELKSSELCFRPLLPNLSFKVRSGDSLVQEIGDINFGLHRQDLEISAPLKGRITELKGKKLRFYQGDSSVREDEIKHEEIRLFSDIVKEKIHALDKEINELRRRIDNLAAQQHLPGISQGSTHERSRIQLETHLKEKEAEQARFRTVQEALKNIQNVPFVWDIAFVEIFESDSAGFDIVIGNPPYVRQEMIAPPRLDPEQYGGDTSARWKEQKKIYKEKLQRSVAAAWETFFNYTPVSEKFRKLDGKSDLYVYFYFHGLSLLNPRGSFCFITSNSWLDVGYGADLQEFLLKHCHVKLVLDNEAERSFAQADVNTVIVLLSPADDRKRWGLDQTARFVMFKKPFEEVARAQVFRDIEAVTERKSTEAYRVTTRPQRELLDEGLESETAEQSPTPEKDKTGRLLIKTGRYIGNKWGGKYLRAPDIFFTILEKGKGKLVRLGDIAEVRRGFTTGANEFFYLEPTGKPAPAGYLHVRNGAGWEGEIEEEFLKPVIKSPRECRSILIKPEDLRYKIFMCHKDKPGLKGTAALEYIDWGESQGYHERPSCKGRPRWWDVGKWEISWNILPMFERERKYCFWNDARAFVDAALYWVYNSRIDDKILNAYLNSTLFGLWKELMARPPEGGGGGPIQIKVYHYSEMPFLVALSELTSAQQECLYSVFGQMASRVIRSVFDEIHQPDRRALDEVVFDVLGLTAGEREAVYEAVVNLVRARLEKARSV